MTKGYAIYSRTLILLQKHYCTMLGLQTSKSIKITYNLNPPSSVQVPTDLPKRITHSYPVMISTPIDEIDNSKAGKTFYRELRKSLEAARNEVGEKLTTWRDLVGKAELNKEPKKVEEDEEESEGADEGEGQT